MINSKLHRLVLDAHEQNDTALLADLYGQAADNAEESGQKDKACFYLTQAYIFALDSGLAVAANYNRRLADHGRDVLQSDLCRVNNEKDI